MPRRRDLEKILIIGSGPIIIGQACEFDYSGTQACKALKEEGFYIILVNSNPATIMTDPEFADRTYIEPLVSETIEKVIKKEKPDALLPTLGGQTSLNLAVELHNKGILDKYNIELIGSKIESIKMAEDRELFLNAMKEINLEMPGGGFATDIESAKKIALEIGFPLIIRPSFTLGGTGGNVINNMDEFYEGARWGLQSSPINEILIEESLIGWKEFELEVMRDKKDNFVIVCSIENFDPMGIHTGDSITVAPAQTLTDKEYQKMRNAAKSIINKIGVETGGANIQFAVHPDTGRMVVIEMNPRVSRSSALASKATGFPIAKIAAKLSVGYTLDEIPNDITQKTPACFEPSIDYVVVKIPRWDFEKFPDSDKTLNTQMKSVGEAMAIGRTFKEAFQKAIRSLEINRFGFGADGNEVIDDFFISEENLISVLSKIRYKFPENIFLLHYALKSGIDVEQLYKITKIDRWFLENLRKLLVIENEILYDAEMRKTFVSENIRKAKENGFSDKQLAFLWDTDEESIRDKRKSLGIYPVFKTVDTCAAEFEAKTPYYYSTYDGENEAVRSNRKKVIILGSGPNRIGQGIEFDYCCVHGILALKELGYEAIMINSNPETVSTDYDIADKLYFEPLTLEDVLNVVEFENPDGVIVQFGGQTPLKLAIPLEKHGVNILGTSSDSIDLAEDRMRFSTLLKSLGLRFPEYGIAYSPEKAELIAERIGFPVLVRPSYVLGGRAMEIIYDRESLRSYIKSAIEVSPDYPILIDKFLNDAYEFDVDAISDGEYTVIGAIMQHIEKAGIHSGDSTAVIPPFSINKKIIDELKTYTYTIAKALKIKGLLNIQYAVKDNKVYVLEANPRASRTIPFVSKTIGYPLAKIATKIMMGKKLKDCDFTEEVEIQHVSIKEPVFPFNKFSNPDIFLRPEMRSTGEVMGISDNFGTAIIKANIATGINIPLKGNVLISVNDNDKLQALNVARSFKMLGFKIIATKGTKEFFDKNGIKAEMVFKVKENRPNIVDLIKDGKINLIINTPLGKASIYDEYAIGRSAIKYNIPCITTIAGAEAIVKGIKTIVSKKDYSVKCLQEYFKPEIKFFKSSIEN
ncbi:carbamoyl phosphate synthase large subunit [candidate division KSB1 bacterium]|nr:MAG: carbamoyl phosphate synthase large subunit [candidate division KSB1 bacterium]